MFFALIMAAWPREDSTVLGDSDAVLVSAARNGHADAFGALHTRYYSRIYRLAYLKTNNAADAEDVASETFMRAPAGLPRFRFSPTPGGARASLYPWLHRIALNLIVDFHRRRPPMGVVSLDAAVKSLLHRAVVALRAELVQRLAAIERREARGMYAQNQTERGGATCRTRITRWRVRRCWPSARSRRLSRPAPPVEALSEP